MEFVIIIGWIILSSIIGNLGKSKTIGYWGAFFVSLFFSPIIGILVVIASSPKKIEKKVNKGVAKITSNALKEYNEKDYEKSLKTLNKAFLIEPSNAITNYNLGVVYSTLENKSKAFLHLEKAVLNGYKNISKIATGEDLPWLKKQQEFENFVLNDFKLAIVKPEVRKDVPKDYISELKELAQLKETGILTEAEFNEKKSEILTLSKS